jgi:hypothetical protein
MDVTTPPFVTERFLIEPRWFTNVHVLPLALESCTSCR